MNVYELDLLQPGSPAPFPELELTAENTGIGSDGWSVKTFTLRGGLQEGVQVVEVNNGRLCYAILPTRGMSIWKGSCGDVQLGWDSPVKDPVHPAFIRPEDRGGLGWLKGFNEWFVRCGLSSMGAPCKDSASGDLLTLHGNIANLPARALSICISEENILVKGEVDESGMFGPALRLNTEISTVPDSSSLTVTDTVSNPGDLPQPHELLYHINFGAGLLEEGSRMLTPFKEVAPRNARAAEGMDTFDVYGAPEPGFAEQVYFYQLAGSHEDNRSLAMLQNQAGDQAAVLRFSLDELPYFVQWKNTAGKADGYVTGLEPATALPNGRNFEQDKGRVIILEPGSSRRSTVTIDVLEGTQAVNAVASEISVLQRQVDGVVRKDPDPELTES